MFCIWKKALAACALLLATGIGAQAATVRLVLDRSYNFNAPFGLAFDGTNLHVSNFTGNRVITELNPATGAPTGRTTMMPFANSALAWSGTQLLAAESRQIRFFDRYTAGNQRTVNGDARIPLRFSLIDGLDFKNGTIWYSQDVSEIFRLDGTTGAFQGPVNPVPVPPNGGFSGVEQIDSNCPDLGQILIVINDAFNPRRLTVARLNGTVIGETTIGNQRYEDLAFDGQFLYAADVFGNRIDRIRVIVDDCEVSSVPEPGTLTIAGVAVLGLLGYRLRRRQQA